MHLRGWPISFGQAMPAVTFRASSNMKSYYNTFAFCSLIHYNRRSVKCLMLKRGLSNPIRSGVLAIFVLVISVSTAQGQTVTPGSGGKARDYYRTF